MHKIKTVLRLAGLGLSQRQIAVSCQVGQATVSDYLRMAAAAGLKWPDIADWDEDRLRTALAPCSVQAPSWRKTDDPDFTQIRCELQTHRLTSTSPCSYSGRSTEKNSRTATATAATVACTATG